LANSKKASKKKLPPKKQGKDTQFKPGNQFWKQRSKHGRDKLFASPELMWEAAEEYFEWMDRNPKQKTEAAKAGDRFGEHVKVPTERPYTLQSLCLYLNCNTAYFRQFKKTASADFSTVITRIEEIIYHQKFEGAAIGSFNANIIARDLGLKEKTENIHDLRLGMDAEEEYVD
jgi:hypothetical protein